VFRIKFSENPARINPTSRHSNPALRSGDHGFANLGRRPVILTKVFQTIATLVP